jgi:pectin methylesterase-like acyl-CoA thioesterase
MPARAETKVLTVGTSGNFQYRTISAAVAAADADSNPNSYYDIQVAPGTYMNDFSVVTRPITIEVDPHKAGNPVLLKATEPLPNQKGIILTFASLTVDGLTFIGAMIDNSLGGNGAGIRDQNTAAGHPDRAQLRLHQ